MGGHQIVILVIALLLHGFGRAREGETVVDIRFVGNERVTAEQMLQTMRTKSGEALEADKISEDIRDLYQRFGVRVTVLEEAVEGGVRLTLEVSEEALITKVETSGVSAPRGREILEEVSLGGARGLLESQVRDRASELERRLQEEGRFFAQVKTSVAARDGGAVAVLEIHEGPKVEVAAINFVGLRSLDPDHLRKVMTTNATRFLLLKSYLRQDVLDRDIIELQRYLQAEGFRDGQVSLEALDFNAAQDEVTVTLRVQEGERYTVGSIRIEGNAALGAEDLYAVLELAEGDPIRQAVLEKDQHRLLARYGELGYIRCAVEPQVAYAAEGTSVAVCYFIDEGDQKRVRAVVITGNTNTKDVVVRRESTLKPGDVASTAELQRTTERLRSLGYFADESGRNLVYARFKPTGDPLLEDLFIDVEETRSGRLFFTAGATTDTGFFAGVLLEKNNFDISDAPSSWDPITLFSEFWRNEAFHGGGQQLTLQALPGNKVSDFRLSFTEPYLFGPEEFPYSLNVELYNRTERLFDDFREDRFGLTTTLGKRIDDHWSAGVSGRLDMVDIEDVDDDAPDDVEDVEGTNFVPGIGVFARYRNLDSLTDPKEGYEVGARYEFMGADAAGTKMVLDGSWFLPLMEDERGRDQVVALRGALGAAQGFGGELPFFERFGGGGSTGPFAIRGFEYRGVGPESSGVHLGGEMAWAAGAEYRFPLYSTYDPLLDEEIELLRGVLFVDAGAVEDTVGDVFGSPRMGAGAGLRIRLPFLGQTPVAIDFGVPVLSESDDETELFSIRVSTRF
ncbi:MAG: outer membrane protein assembly factor [Planctomycetes bacterium]|nr:outer membrane protein assembly factor [Planctomycetota bacterium]